MLLPVVGAASGIPPTGAGDSATDSIVGLVTAGQFQAAEVRFGWKIMRLRQK